MVQMHDDDIATFPAIPRETAEAPVDSEPVACVVLPLETSAFAFAMSLIQIKFHNHLVIR